jgi:galactose-1-phosphate uridylyltransferase
LSQKGEKMKVKTAEDLFKALVKAGVFMNTEDGVKAFAQLLITLNSKYPKWRENDTR